MATLNMPVTENTISWSDHCHAEKVNSTLSEENISRLESQQLHFKSVILQHLVIVVLLSRCDREKKIQVELEKTPMDVNVMRWLHSRMAASSSSFSAVDLDELLDELEDEVKREEEEDQEKERQKKREELKQVQSDQGDSLVDVQEGQLEENKDVVQEGGQDEEQVDETLENAHLEEAAGVGNLLHVDEEQVAVQEEEEVVIKPIYPSEKCEEEESSNNVDNSDSKEEEARETPEEILEATETVKEEDEAETLNVQEEVDETGENGENEDEETPQEEEEEDVQVVDEEIVQRELEALTVETGQENGENGQENDENAVRSPSPPFEDVYQSAENESQEREIEENAENPPPYHEIHSSPQENGEEEPTSAPAGAGATAAATTTTRTETATPEGAVGENLPHLTTYSRDTLYSIAFNIGSSIYWVAYSLRLWIICLLSHS